MAETVQQLREHLDNPAPAVKFVTGSGPGANTDEASRQASALIALADPGGRCTWERCWATPL